MTTHTIAAAVFALWTGAASHTAAPSSVDARDDLTPPAVEGEAFAEGSFRVKYLGLGAGREAFKITKAEDGWRVSCALEPPKGDLKHSDTVYHLTPERRFVRAEHTEVESGGVTVTYTLEDGQLVARGTHADGSALPEKRVDVDQHAIVSGPNYATDFFVLYPFDLDVGETITVDAAVFGFRSWEPEALRLTVTRNKDRRVRGEGGEWTDTIVYEGRLEMTDKTVRTRSFLDPATGEVQRVAIDMPLGWAKILRD